MSAHNSPCQVSAHGEGLKTSLRYLRTRVNPSTIIVGIKCTDGVVVASDSQSEFGRGVDVKRLNATKIESHDGRYVFAGSGTLAHIEVLVENVMFYIHNQEQLQRSQLNRDEAEKSAEQALWALVKHYVVDRSGALGVSDRAIFGEDFFTPIAIFAGSHAENGVIEYYLYFLHGREGMVEPLKDYGAAGSGAAYAELLLKGLYSENITVDEASKVAIYTVEEVKAIDPHCGGDTQVAIIKTESSNKKRNPVLRVFSKLEIESIIRDIRPKLDLLRTTVVGKVLRGEIDEDKIRKITKNP